MLDVLVIFTRFLRSLKAKQLFASCEVFFSPAGGTALHAPMMCSSQVASCSEGFVYNYLIAIAKHVCVVCSSNVMYIYDVNVKYMKNRRQ